MTSRKLLVVNADDFGFTPDVNAGIVEAHRSGILTAATLMANGAAFDDAVRCAQEDPELDVGCHLVLVGGMSVRDPATPLPAAIPDLVSALVRRAIPVYEELKAQVTKIVAAGIEPSHLDTHKHSHLLPPVLDAVARISEEFGIRWVRRPFDLPLTGAEREIPLLRRATSGGMQFLRARFHRVLESRGCWTTDHFAGYQITGGLHAEQLVRLVRKLPAGLTELMCHPGYCRDELQCAETRLKESREQELAALTDPAVNAAIKATGVELVTFRELTDGEPISA